MKEILINKDIISDVVGIAESAGSEIMKIYKTDFQINTKQDKRLDGTYTSPVTEADTNANDIIVSSLSNITNDIPILSEEGKDIPYNERNKWKSYWLIDPLDGTKEFIKKNNEFTVNIAYLVNNKPIFGVVYAPALHITYWGLVGLGSFKQKNNYTKPIKVNKKLNSRIQIAVSRSHISSQIDKFISRFDKYDLHPMGSSLKICSVAEGTVDLYPRLGPTMEWDTAASHAIIKAAGGNILKYKDNSNLIYNKPSLINPEFIVGDVNNIKAISLME